MDGDYSNDITLECAFDTIYRETAADGGTAHDPVCAPF